MNIYISNLQSGVGENELNQLFSSFGVVRSTEIAMDLFSGESRGFGYVDMEDDAAGNNAISKLNQTEFHGAVVTVKQVPDKKVHQGSYKVGSGVVNVYKFRKGQ